MARTTITQILAVVTQFGDNLNKYEEENKKLKLQVNCSVKTNY